MFIYLRGVGSINKGAELMAHAVCDSIRKHLPLAKIAAPIGLSFATKNRLNLYQRVGAPNWLVSLSAKFIPNLLIKLQRQLGLCFDRDFDIILDASGFALGDVWGPNRAEKFARQTAFWRKQGATIILLPQAFGPFSNLKIRTAMKAILKHVDLVYARDALSYTHLKTLNVCLEKIKIAPDFTSLVEPCELEKYSDLWGQICISPNIRLIKTDSSIASDRYLALLKHIVGWLRAKKISFYFLIHETKEDRKIVEKLNSQLQTAVKVVEEADPIILKSIIGKSRAFIGSRYHALLNALNQCVPSLCIGWSHKYSQLMQSFDLARSEIDLGDSESKIEGQLELLIDPKQAEQTKISLKFKANEYQALSDVMWKEVFAFLVNKNNLAVGDKVVHITTIHPYNDPRIFHKECASLARRGFNVVLLAPVEHDFEEKFIAVKALGATGRKLYRICIMLPRALARAIQERPKICHIHDPEILLIAPLLRIFGIKVIYDVHEDYRTAIMNKTDMPKILLWPYSRIFGFFEKLLARTARCVLAERYYAERFHNGTFVLNYPLQDFAHVQTTDRIAPTLNTQYNWFFYSGFITEPRGAFNHLRLLYLNQKAALFMIGLCKEELYLKIMKQAHEWSISSDRIIIVGRNTYVNPTEIMKATFEFPWSAGLALFPANAHYLKTEPTKFFEYMAAGIPVFASDFPTWHELIKTNRIGLTANPTNDADLQFKMNGLLENDLRLQAALGPELIKNKFSFESQADTLGHLYTEMLRADSHS